VIDVVRFEAGRPSSIQVVENLSELGTTYSYDSNGRLITTTNYDVEGSRTSSEDHSYNEAGLRTRTAGRQHAEGISAGQPTRSWTVDYSYDQFGNETRRNQSFENGVRNVTTSHYDSVGNLLEEIRTSFVPEEGTCCGRETQYRSDRVVTSYDYSCW